jgi:hypothetical protein
VMVVGSKLDDVLAVSTPSKQVEIFYCWVEERVKA